MACLTWPAIRAPQVGNLTQVVVRAAGHIVPGDQPVRAFDMIERFVEGRPYRNLPNPVPVPSSVSE